MSEMHWPEITKDTPLTEVKRIHQAIWDYVIEHGEKPNTPYRGNCACCEYDSLFNDDCSACPITPFTEISCCGGLYKDWCDADSDKKAKIAKLIHDILFESKLEEKQDV